MVNSFIEYWQEVECIRKQIEGDSLLFFRGQSNGDHEKMLPGICRPDAKNEREQYLGTQIDYPEEFARDAHFSNLIKMQHYGSETRLLDFSLNPLISLYFACEFDPSKCGKVFVVPVSKQEVLFHNSDKVLMLSCLPAFSEEDKAEIRRFCEAHRGVITDQDICFSNVMKRFLHEIRGEYPAFETAIVGEDLLKYYFVRPKKDNERMKRQEGVFAIFGLDESRLVDELNARATVITIEPSAKAKIREDLALMRICTSTVYPDLERNAMLLRDRIAKWEKM